MAVEGIADRWADAFAALDQPGRRLSPDGRAVRLMASTPDQVETELGTVGIAAKVRTVPATSHETPVELDG